MVEWSLYSILAFLLIARFCFNFVLTVTSFLNAHLIKPLLSYNRDFPEKYGKWAVVTGCSRGIGKCYALELAKRGMNVVLISQSNDLLQKLSTEIESTYKVKTLVIVSDMSLGDEEHLKIFKKLEGLDVGVLVNNVGTANGIPNYIEVMTRKELWNILLLNICAATSMTHLLLPQMKKRGRGLIINNSSITSYTIAPYGVLYGSSKAYMTRFSDSLKAECQGTGVEVQTLCPGFVDTGFVDTNAKYQPRLFFPSPEKFVSAAIETIGTDSVTGYWPHDLQYIAMESGPVWLKNWVCSKFVNVEKIKAKARSHRD